MYNIFSNTFYKNNFVEIFYMKNFLCEKDRECMLFCINLLSKSSLPTVNYCLLRLLERFICALEIIYFDFEKKNSK